MSDLRGNRIEGLKTALRKTPKGIKPYVLIANAIRVFDVKEKTARDYVKELRSDPEVVFNGDVMYIQKEEVRE